LLKGTVDDVRREERKELPEGLKVWFGLCSVWGNVLEDHRGVIRNAVVMIRRKTLRCRWRFCRGPWIVGIQGRSFAVLILYVYYVVVKILQRKQRVRKDRISKDRVVVIDAGRRNYSALAITPSCIEVSAIVISTSIKELFLTGKRELPINSGGIPVNITSHYYVWVRIPFLVRVRTEVKVR
jgi:hypothetical protein